MRALICGLVNVETTLKIKQFPIEYFPIDYPFFGIRSSVSGVAYNVAKALLALDNDIQLASFVGKDDEGRRILSALENDKISTNLIREKLLETPVSIALFDDDGRREIYCDLKDIQERELAFSDISDAVSDSDAVILCNINFNRSLLKEVKKAGKLIACDVHVISDINDDFNRDFMENADVLFLSDEKIPCAPEEFLCELKTAYSPQIIVMGLGARGAMLYERESDKIYKSDAVKLGNVVNTIGAGDALFSAFLNYYSKGFSALDSLYRAEIFASLKIQHNGAAKGFSSEGDVEKIYETYPAKITEVNVK